MGSTFDGDLIRPLGLLTLYFGYAEAELDELLKTLSAVERCDERMLQMPVGQKLARARSLIIQLDSNALAGLSAALDEARVLFERRNVLVHSCILAGGRVVSSRPGTPEQRVTAIDLTELADAIFTCKEHINANRQRRLQPLLAARGTSGGT